MYLEIRNIIKFKDDPKGDFINQSNFNETDLKYFADSDKLEETDDCNPIVHDFKIDNVNKYVFRVTNDKPVDILILEDILKNYVSDEVRSIHIFCYESTSNRPFRLPVKFDVILDSSDQLLTKCSEFSIGNLKSLTTDIRVNNVDVPSGTAANLVFIIATKDLQ